MKRLNHRMILLRDVCLEKLVLISTLHDERTKFKHLLEIINKSAPKSKDPMLQLPLPRKIIDLETAQSKLPLIFPSFSTEIIGKTSPPITTPLYSLPNNAGKMTQTYLVIRIGERVLVRI